MSGDIVLSSNTVSCKEYSSSIKPHPVHAYRPTINALGMRFNNAYVCPPAPALPPNNVHLDTPSESYDLNFCGGDVYPLQTDKIALIPFIPKLHAEAYYTQIKGNNDLMRYMPYNPRLESGLNETCAAIEIAIRRKPVRPRLLLDVLLGPTLIVLPDCA